MPIRPELRALYSGPAWASTRARILRRCGYRCEKCHKRDRARIETVTIPERKQMFWRPWREQRYRDKWNRWRNQNGEQQIWPYPWKPQPRVITVVLAVIHLNQTAGDDRDENLSARCQWCHLLWDRACHLANAARTRRAKKDRARPLLAMEGAA
jgi:hypothetical protein